MPEETKTIQSLLNDVIGRSAFQKAKSRSSSKKKWDILYEWQLRLRGMSENDFPSFFRNVMLAVNSPLCSQSEMARIFDLVEEDPRQMLNKASVAVIVARQMPNKKGKEANGEQEDQEEQEIVDEDSDNEQEDE